MKRYVSSSEKDRRFVVFEGDFCRRLDLACSSCFSNWIGGTGTFGLPEPEGGAALFLGAMILTSGALTRSRDKKREGERQAKTEVEEVETA